MLGKKDKYNVGIIGSTGLIGKTLIKLLEESSIPINNLYLFASPKSIGTIVKFKNQNIRVNKFDEEFYDILDIVFITAPASVSSKYVPKLINKNILIIDNSSYYRLFDGVPLVTPYVNDQNLIKYRLIANPNCSTIQAVSVLKIIDDLFKLSEINYATYQAVSGSGYKGVLDLERRKKSFYPYSIIKTCIPSIGSATKNNNTEEENKMINETKKILNNKKLKISATCVRVPILLGHGIVTTIKTKKKISINLLKEKLSQNPRIVIKDDLPNNIYPTSIDTYNNDSIYVGRFRLINNKELVFYSTSNNLLTGAASNSIYICEKYLTELHKKMPN